MDGFLPHLQGELRLNTLVREWLLAHDIHLAGRYSE